MDDTTPRWSHFDDDGYYIPGGACLSDCEILADRRAARCVECEGRGYHDVSVVQSADCPDCDGTGIARPSSKVPAQLVLGGGL